MRYLILVACLVSNLNVLAADIRGGRCFPETAQEIIDFYRHAKCGEHLAGLQPKGLMRKGITVEKDRAAVLFDFDSTHIKAEFLAMLQQWGQALTRLDDLHFRLEGHADMKGEAQYNDRLSVQRAEKLKDYFVQHFAIDAARFEIQGFGETQPLEGLPASPDEAQRRWNRRVELVKIAGEG